jgi:hypothetical protein
LRLTGIVASWQGRTSRYIIVAATTLAASCCCCFKKLLVEQLTTTEMSSLIMLLLLLASLVLLPLIAQLSIVVADKVTVTVTVVNPGICWITSV